MINVKKAGGFNKVRGLIARKEAEAILIQTRFGIHTFGLRFPIDILIIDKHGIARAVRHAFKPNGIFLWNPRYQKVIELPEGFLKKHRIQKGEKVRLSFQ